MRPFLTIPVNTMVATRWPVQGRGTGLGVGEPGWASYTLSATHEHAVCCWNEVSDDASAH